LSGGYCSIEDLLTGACPGELIPSERRSRIFTRLLEQTRAAGNAPRAIIDIDDDDLALLAVTAADWPGLATICLSELHHHGWNLDYAEGIAVEDAGVRRGFVMAGIRSSDPSVRKRFEQDAVHIQGLLEKLAEGRADTMTLLARASERLEVYEEVRSELVKLAAGKEALDSLVGPGGELLMFMSSRSDEYLRERRPEDLASVVLTNYQLVEGVRSRGGKPLFKARNLRTAREHLTGINIAGYERDISFQDCLTALSFAWPGSTVRHQRKYTTSDGIVCIRLEMTGPSALAASRDEVKRIGDTLKKLLVKKELERLKRIHSYGGREHYARALIPLLLRECESTKLSQAYIALESSTTFSAELKLLLVLMASDMEDHDNKVLEIVGSIDRLEGMTVISFKSPSSYGQRWVDIINITVDRNSYPEIEDAYDAIKKCIEAGIGQFRDFDMGMRLNDVRQLREIRELLKDIPDSVVTDFYYRLEDFLRAGSPVEELAQHIRIAFDAMSSALRDGLETYGPTISIVHNGELDVATLFCCVLPERMHTFQSFLDVVREYRVTASLIDWSGLHAVLLRVHDSGGALNERDTVRVLESLRQQMGSLGASGKGPSST
jgi:hypothetical protein